jgi:hypothetical protein
MMTACSCDVLMPVHNGALPHLIAAVDSILSQRDVVVRLLIADDGTDDTSVSRWLQQLAAERSNNVVLVRSEHCQGVSAALNRLLPLCRSAFVARMDADDVAAPTRLAEQIAFLQAHPDVDIVGTNAILFSETAKRRTTLPTAPAAVHFGMLFACALVHPSVMWRANMCASIVYDAAEHPRCEDFALWHALLRRGFKLANLDAPLLHLRKHHRSVSAVHADEQRRSTAALAPLAYDAERLALDAVLALRGAILDAVPRVCEWAGAKFSSDERAAVAACAEQRVAELLALALQRMPQHATALVQAMPPHLLADLLASVAAPRRAAPKLLPWSSPTITALLFSKDRPFQAQQCLESFDAIVVQPCAAYVNFSVHVLYAASSERTRAHYAALADARTGGATFIDEASEPCDAVLRRLFKPADAFAMFLVDDIVWYRTPPALPAALERLASRSDLFALQLRLHRNVCQSVTTGMACAPPQSLLTTAQQQWCEWRADVADAVAEWRYPFDLSGAIYRQRDIASIVHTAATLLGVESLTHPNRFENAGNQVLRRQLLAELDSGVRLMCPVEPCMSIVTVNRVQQVCANPICGDERSTDELLGLFERHGAFDIARYRAESKRFTTVHIGDWFLRE